MSHNGTRLILSVTALALLAPTSALADDPSADTAAAVPQFAPARGVQYAPGITSRDGHFMYYDVADPSRSYRPARGVQLAKGWVIRNGRLQRVS
jgi:hypothetical protein